MEIEKRNPLILIPTYNERENVKKLFEGITALGLNADILFLDDNSPDGTGEILDELAGEYGHVNVIHRPEKLGIGSAHQEGIKWAYERNYHTLITMDCDFTHPPEYIPEIMKKAEDSDIVVGSRYLMKNSLEGWNIQRKFLTILGHTMTKYLLKLPYDATGAFRLYRLDKIPNYAFKTVSSRGYSFFFESLYILNLNRFIIREIPIVLPPRTYGHSKMRIRDAWHSFSFLFAIYLTTLFNREKFEVYEPFVPQNEKIPFPRDEQGWDYYWQSQKSSGGLVYDALAAFYRKYIIKRTLNYFARKYFARGSNVLHAGCGGGQVDTDLCTYIDITAMDISEKALSLYKKVNKNKCKLIHGNLYSIPLPDGTFDGIYNLGVMEHFEENDIMRILNEFYRVLKPGGRVIIFWPPEFGISVIFFKILRKVLKPFLKREPKFHPEEICRIKSKDHAIQITNRANFNINEYYFGIKDFFTYSIIVMDKK